jgi:hypothetical protein
MGMRGLHSATKGEREVIRQLVHTVLVRDMNSFTPDRFKDWIKGMDTNFRKVGLTLAFRIYDRSVQFTVKQIRGSRTIYQFASATRVQFDDSEVVMTVAQVTGYS